MIQSLIETLAGLPPLVIYLIIGVGAALENPLPPIPADTFVLFGAFLAAAGAADPLVVFLVTWFCNVAAALGMYSFAWHHGDRFFRTTVGRHLLNPAQLRQIEHFYGRFGHPAIFMSRFLPGLRALVPVFAGVSRVPLRNVVPPLAFASALWYGFLVWIGATAGRNWEAIQAAFSRYSGPLGWVAVPVMIGIGYWWWRSRRDGGD